MESGYRNKNRGYQQLRVWQDAIDFYVALLPGIPHRFPTNSSGWHRRELPPPTLCIATSRRDIVAAGSANICNRSITRSDRLAKASPG
jgi:hypothetical protein